MVGETRLPDFGPAAFERVRVGRLRRTEILHVQLTVFLQRFGVAQSDLRSSDARYPQPAPAHHVLAHVHDEDAETQLPDTDCMQGFDHSQRPRPLPHHPPPPPPHPPCPPPPRPLPTHTPPPPHPPPPPPPL